MPFWFNLETETLKKYKVKLLNYDRFILCICVCVKKETVR